MVRGTDARLGRASLAGFDPSSDVVGKRRGNPV